MNGVAGQRLQPDAYLFDRTDREYRRLSIQAQIWEAATRRALDVIPIQAQCTALDVGCGPGDAMRLISDYLPADGCVTGMDIDGDLRAGPLAQLLRSDPKRFRFVQADVSQPTVVPDAPFDLVFARLLLFHLRSPVPVLERLWSWVRPGGTLIVMDYDITSTRSYPQQPAIERAGRLIFDTFRRVGRDIEIGTRLPELFLQAHIGTPDGCEVASVVLPAEPSTQMVRDVLAGLKPAILQFDIIDAPRLERLDCELQAAASTRTFMRWPDMVTAWKAKAR